MADLTYPEKIRQSLETIPIGRLHLIDGVKVEKLGIGLLYRIAGRDGLLTLSQAQDYLVQHCKKKEPMAQQDAPIIEHCPSGLKAVTVRFPWAWLSVRGYKNAEYRSRKVKFPSIVLIHAGTSKLDDDVIEQYNIPRTDIVRGAILGAARITGCQWEEDSWAYHYEDQIAFDKPILNVPGEQPVFWASGRSRKPERGLAFDRAWHQLQEMDWIGCRYQLQEN